MTPEAQRMAIAKACGWKWYRRPATGPWANNPMRALYHPALNAEYVATLLPADMTERQCNNVFIWREGMIPDYLNDLNAMHEAEKTLTMGQLVKYGDLLNKMQLSPGNYGFVEQVINATARQRAEAFLRTIGKWEE